MSSVLRNIIIVPFVAVFLTAVFLFIFFNNASIEPSSDQYLAYTSSQGHEDGGYIWNDFKHISGNLRKSDIVFVGNSHILLGIDLSTLEPFARENNLRFYNLGFGNNEGIQFPLMIFDKFNIAPKCVIVNVDNATFSKPLSGYATSVVQSKRYSSISRIYFNYFYFFAERTFKAFCEMFLGAVSLADHSKVEPYAFRSSTDGSWRFYQYTKWRWQRYSFKNLRSFTECVYDEPIGPEEYAAAQDFLNAMQRLGTRVIFTSVPYDNMGTLRYRRLSEALHVPFVDIHDLPLKTYDGAHLDPDSAVLFTQELLSRLKAEPALLRLMPQAP